MFYIRKGKFPQQTLHKRWCFLYSVFHGKENTRISFQISLTLHGIEQQQATGKWWLRNAGPLYFYTLFCIKPTVQDLLIKTSAKFLTYKKVKTFDIQKGQYISYLSSIILKKFKIQYFPIELHQNKSFLGHYPTLSHEVLPFPGSGSSKSQFHLWSALTMEINKIWATSLELGSSIQESTELTKLQTFLGQFLPQKLTNNNKKSVYP